MSNPDIPIRGWLILIAVGIGIIAACSWADKDIRKPIDRTPSWITQPTE